MLRSAVFQQASAAGAVLLCVFGGERVSEDSTSATRPKLGGSRHKAPPHRVTGRRHGTEAVTPMQAQDTLTLGQRHVVWWRARLTEPSFVYVVQAQPGTPVKIGVARDVDARLAGLQTGNPYKLRVLFVLPGGYELEWQFHQKLKKYRMEGEWFDARAAEKIFPLIERLAVAMVAAYDGSGVIPTYRQRGFDWKRVRRQQQTVTVRRVDPTPVDPELAVQRLTKAWTRPPGQWGHRLEEAA